MPIQSNNNWNAEGLLPIGYLLIGTGTVAAAARISDGTNIVWTLGAGTLQANLSGPIGVSFGGLGTSNFSENSVLIGNGSGPVNWVTLGTNQLLVGTGTLPQPASLVSGGGLDIYSAPGTITLRQAPLAFAYGIPVSTGTGYLALYQEPGYLLIGTSTSDFPVSAFPTDGTNISWSVIGAPYYLKANLSGVLSPAQGGTGTDNSLVGYSFPVAMGSSTPFQFVGPFPNGYLIIGTGTVPKASPLLGSDAITISNNAGTIGISGTDAGTVTAFGVCSLGQAAFNLTGTISSGGTFVPWTTSVVVVQAATNFAFGTSNGIQIGPDGSGDYLITGAASWAYQTGTSARTSRAFVAINNSTIATNLTSSQEADSVVSTGGFQNFNIVGLLYLLSGSSINLGIIADSPGTFMLYSCSLNAIKVG